MAHYYGILQGSRGAATRCGTRTSGLNVVAASWAGAVDVRLYERDGETWADVRLVPWHGRGITQTLYDGPVGGGNLAALVTATAPSGAKAGSERRRK